MAWKDLLELCLCTSCIAFTPYAVTTVQTGELNPMGALLLHSLGSSPFSFLANESKITKEEKGPSRVYCYCQHYQAKVFSEPLSRGFPNFLYHTSHNKKEIIIYSQCCVVLWIAIEICLDIQCSFLTSHNVVCLITELCTRSDVLLRRRIPFWYSFLLIIIVMRCCKRSVVKIFLVSVCFKYMPT